MSRKQKMIDRLRSKPKDMTFRELEALILALGYKKHSKGKTSGSRVEFRQDGKSPIRFHRPHGSRKELLRYEIDYALGILESEELI